MRISKTLAITSLLIMAILSTAGLFVTAVRGDARLLNDSEHALRNCDVA